MMKYLGHMKKRLLTVLLLFIAFTAFSQKSEQKVVSIEKIIGKNLQSNKYIKGINYVFPDYIHVAFADDAAKVLTTELCTLDKSSGLIKNKGKLLIYNLESKEIEWTKKVHYRTEGLKYSGDYFIQTIRGENSCYNKRNGEKLWSNKNSIYNIDPTLNIILGYKYVNMVGYTNKLQGFNIEDGSILWERKINKKYGWTDIINMNDSVKLVVADGIHQLNIKTGEGWHYEAETGEENFVPEVDKSCIGSVAEYKADIELLSAVYTRSNIIFHGDDIIMASKEKISRIDKNDGHVKWSTPIKPSYGSKSKIFIEGNTVYLINTGYALANGRRVRFGFPSFGGFSLETGKQLFFLPVDNERRVIQDFKYSDDKLVILFFNNIWEYSLEEGKLLKDKQYTTHRHGQYMNFVGDNIFVKTGDNEFTPVANMEADKYYVYTSKGNVMVFDSKFKKEGVIGAEKLWFSKILGDDMTLLSHKNRSVIVNKDLKVIADLYMSKNAFLAGDKLFDVQGKNIVEVDLSELKN